MHLGFTVQAADISIHALREEGDHIARVRFSGSFWDFYPRPPRGGRRHPAAGRSLGGAISIHALREEGDRIATRRSATRKISIHALREEGD